MPTTAEEYKKVKYIYLIKRRYIHHESTVMDESDSNLVKNKINFKTKANQAGRTLKALQTEINCEVSAGTNLI